MNIGLIDVDGHNYPNFALMRLSAWHRQRGDSVEWADQLFGSYDRIYKSKIFTFTPDNKEHFDCEIVKGGTGYDVHSRLPAEIEASKAMDYSIYPQYDYSLQFFSRGCIRQCPFCLVSEKEGAITPVEPVDLNPNGKYIQVLDNNFFANPEWRDAVSYLHQSGLPAILRGIDVRIMDDEQAYALNNIRMYQSNAICIAWDNGKVDLTDKLTMLTKRIKPSRLTCYVLIGFNSTPEEDLYRLYRLRELGIRPHVQPYRDYANQREVTQYEKDLARWSNRLPLFKTTRFEDYQPRKGFKCSQYLIQ